MPERAQDDRELLVRLEERMSGVQRQLDGLATAILKDREEAKADYVTKTEFIPIQRAAYAAIGFILTAVFGAILSLVFKAHV